MITQLNQFLQIIIQNFPAAFSFTLLLWIIHLFNMLSMNRLSLLGIIPRFWPSLPLGPFFSPLLHADATHLAHNSFPLLILTSILFSKGITPALCIMISCAYLSGVLTWIFARTGCHIGSSALVMSLMGYLLYQAYTSPSISSIAVALVIVYYFGSLLLSFLPEDEKVSFEGHFFGLVSGIAIGYTGCIPLFKSLAQLISQLITTINLF
ncbi:rhomboid family intramembrane serine protease [Candidatus Comchoanobacter bicostacola]|uniref:Rhomboid family intramembrane serine protease n=1 Tax=Candidatus Comchoanobacter bicostacola TaxID=2919598 RepID=A0ABY5DKB2_9GAMM|nr:rhomboid family intramembrane serine protease [Candidatus Comchoanobacter bicostacola]UTC24928.1 rhomboid family intramembrane serine protease [Candidatus Comchoanobacter bicostacola]